jgi:hypothetical protein
VPPTMGHDSMQIGFRSQENHIQRNPPFLHRETTFKNAFHSVSRTICAIKLDSTIISERKAHQGLMREDLVVLRHIFNLNHGIYTLDQDRLKPLGLGSKLPDSDIKDLLIVSIDIENPYIAQLSENSRYQTRLSMLDTRGLQAFIYDQKQDSLELLETCQFCISSKKGFKMIPESYCFGKSKRTILKDLQFIIQTLISDQDAVLVVDGGSGPCGDLSFLEAAEISMCYRHTKGSSAST